MLTVTREVIPPTPEQEAELEALGGVMKKVAKAGAIISAPFRAIFKNTNKHESMLMMIRFVSISQAKKAVSYLKRQISKRHVLKEEQARKFLDLAKEAWAVDTSQRAKLEDMLKLSKIMNAPYVPTLEVVLSRAVKQPRTGIIWNVAYNDEDSKFFGHIVWDHKEALTLDLVKLCVASGMELASLIPASENKAATADDDKRVLAALEDQCSACQKAVTIATRRLCSGCKAARYCNEECQLKHWNAEGGHKAQCKKLANLARAIQLRVAGAGAI